MTAIPRTTAQIRKDLTAHRDALLELLKTWAEGPLQQWRDEVYRLLIDEGVEPRTARSLVDYVQDDGVGIGRYAPHLADVLDDMTRHVSMIDRAVTERRDINARGVNAVFNVDR